MKRRVFIARSVLVSLGTAGLASACARMTPSTRSNRFEISLAEWSLHRALRAGQLDHLDFAVAARRDYGLAAVEYVNTFFKDKARDTSYLRELQRRADGAGVRSLLIMCDGEGQLGDVDAGKRAQAVENHYRWVEAARLLGCHSIRVNADSQAASPAEQMKLAADGLRRLAEFGAQHAIDIIVENHGGSSTNGDWLVGLLRLADHPRLGTLPDFGNFQTAHGEWYDRYRGVDQMMPYARGVSAKSHDFDANGNEVNTDYRRMMQIVLSHGYGGYVGIEYEGDRLSEPDGIRATRDLLLRVRAELSG
jgi:sugar phosphate isomerase/epimerase